MHYIKKIVFIISLIISSNSFSQERTIIYGKIENSMKDSISIIINDKLIGGENNTHKSKIDSNGNFKIIISLNEPKEAILISSKKNIGLFISPKDSIYCTYDDNEIIETINFEGNNSKQYNYFVKYYKKFGEHHGSFFKPRYDDVFKMNPSDFKKYRKEKVENDLLFLKKYSNNYTLTKEFSEYAKVEIKYSYYYALLSYHSFKKYFKKIEEVLPDDFYKEINSKLFNIDTYLNSKNYINATKMYINELNVGVYTTPKLYFPKAINVSEKLLSGKTLFNYQLNILSEMLNTDASIKLKDSLVSSYLKKCPYNKYNSVLTRDYKQVIIANNQNLPKDVLESLFETLEGKEKKFSEILKKHKNKVIYIDIWASWCGPCIIEMPTSIALKDKFKNNDVIFIYLSIDNKKELWKKAIKELGIKGDQFLIKNGLNSSFGKHFNIQGIPHYILINKGNKIIFPSAARPSSKSIETSIITLLNE